MDLTEARQLIRQIPDYPLPGIRFQDLTPLLADGAAFAAVVEALLPLAQGCDAVAGIEARGFIFASAVAHARNLGFVPIRKAGKLPFLTLEEGYGLEYGSDVLQIHQDAVEVGARILVLDDVLATGGTAKAACRLVERLGGTVEGVGFVIELTDLAGRSRLREAYPDLPIKSLYSL